MTQIDSVSAAASLLLRHWRAETKLASLPEKMRPADRATAYRVGASIAELSGDKVVGWKIAATSEAGQKHINVNGPLAGRLLSGRIIAPGGQISLDGNIMKVAEIEFAFSFIKSLPRRPRLYRLGEVMDAVAALHLSIEVPDSRFSDFTTVGELQLIADTACACWLILGPAAGTLWRDIDLAKHPVSAILNGHRMAEGTGKAALGDPLHALTWLVNEVAEYAEGIRAGDFVTTGTCIVPEAIAPGDVFTADYGKLGSLSGRMKNGIFHRS
jgi:2-keto-4-pentenoate hydratase